MRLAASVPGGMLGKKLLSVRPSHQRNSAPNPAPTNIAMIDFNRHLSSYSNMDAAGIPTPTALVLRRHHQPLARRFKEVCHLLWIDYTKGP